MAKNTETAKSFEAGESNARAVRNPETEDGPQTRRRAAKSADETATATAAGDAGAAPAGTDVVQPPTPRAPRKRAAAGKHRK